MFNSLAALNYIDKIKTIFIHQLPIHVIWSKSINQHVLAFIYLSTGSYESNYIKIKTPYR